MRSALILTTVLLLLVRTPVWADDAPDPASGAAIQSVISQQLDAFGKDDGATAESFAAPGIRDKFPDANTFMSMVRNSYSALVRPKSTHFGELSQTGLGLVQKMTIVDSNGTVWTAAYTMTQVDGQWRISGCFMLKSQAVDA